MRLITLPAVRAWQVVRARICNLLKWISIGLAVLLVAFLAAISVVMEAGLHKLNSRSAPVRDYVKVTRTPEQIQRGQAIADSFCGACHSKTGTLTGGADLGKDFPISVGSFISST